VSAPMAASLADAGISPQRTATKTAAAASSRNAPVPVTQTAPVRAGSSWSSRWRSWSVVGWWQSVVVTPPPWAPAGAVGTRGTPQPALGITQEATPRSLDPWSRRTGRAPDGG
jgi:hypothetical protein